MKSISITILIFFQVLIGHSQIAISAKVIPWKELDNLDSLKILIRSSNREIFSAVFYIDEFKHIDGEYPRTIIKFELNEAKKNVDFEVSYKYKKSFETKTPEFSLPEVLKVPVNNREVSIELEIHFHKYSSEDFNVISKEMIDRLIARKIYKLVDGIELIRSWEPKISSSPMYFIQNNSPYKLYGTAGDGKFDGELFKIVGDNLRKVYTGGYNLDNEPTKQLYSNNYVLSFIRDHRETNNKYKISDSGEYIYKVYLGFYPYEHSDRFGQTPYFSVSEYNCINNDNKHKIYEYFELKDEFQIK